MKVICDSNTFMKDIQQNGQFINHQISKIYMQQMNINQRQLSNEFELKILQKRIRKKYKIYKQKLNIYQINKYKKQIKNNILNQLLDHYQNKSFQKEKNITQHKLYREMFNISEPQVKQEIETRRIDKNKIRNRKTKNTDEYYPSTSKYPKIPINTNDKIIEQKVKQEAVIKYYPTYPFTQEPTPPTITTDTMLILTFKQKEEKQKQRQLQKEKQRQIEKQKQKQTQRQKQTERQKQKLKEIQSEKLRLKQNEQRQRQYIQKQKQKQRMRQKQLEREQRQKQRQKLQLQIKNITKIQQNQNINPTQNILSQSHIPSANNPQNQSNAILSSQLISKQQSNGRRKKRQKKIQKQKQKQKQKVKKQKKEKDDAKKQKRPYNKRANLHPQPVDIRLSQPIQPFNPIHPVYPFSISSVSTKYNNIVRVQIGIQTESQDNTVENNNYKASVPKPFIFSLINEPPPIRQQMTKKEILSTNNQQKPKGGNQVDQLQNSSAQEQRQRIQPNPTENQEEEKIQDDIDIGDYLA